ncbi:MAG: hypothetical protein WB475_05330, partial [Pseudolabrys sp.]
GKRRRRNTTGGYQSLWTSRVALGPRQLLNKQHENGPVFRGARVGFFARRTTLARSSIVPKLLGRSTQIAAFFN